MTLSQIIIDEMIVEITHQVTIYDPLEVFGEGIFLALEQSSQ
jgi:hypothetical protein